MESVCILIVVVDNAGRIGACTRDISSGGTRPNRAWCQGPCQAMPSLRCRLQCLQQKYYERALKNLFCYIYLTVNLGLVFKINKNFYIINYFNLNYVINYFNRKFIFKYIYIFAGKLIT